MNSNFFVGDGNLHLNITSREYDPELFTNIEPYIYQWVSHHKGSISAEHGLGLRKREFIGIKLIHNRLINHLDFSNFLLGFSKSQTSIKWMKKFKELLDPNAILNPYKVL